MLKRVLPLVGTPPPDSCPLFPSYTHTRLLCMIALRVRAILQYNYGQKYKNCQLQVISCVQHFILIKTLKHIINFSICHSGDYLEMLFLEFRIKNSTVMQRH